jgi:uroporphyrinogen decarboxylase
MLTSRERVLCALDHREPDRVPIFFGAPGVTSMLSPAYEQLKAHLGVRAPAREFSRVFQYAMLDDEVMERFGADSRPLVPGPAPSIHRRDLGNDRFVDDWGIEWHRPPGDLYFASARAPLREATLDNLERYEWPDLAHPSRFLDIAVEARRLQEAGLAVSAVSGVDPFEIALLLRGMDAFLMDMLTDRDFAKALLDRVTAVMLGGLRALLHAAGPWIDIVSTSDDLGTQHAPMISPAMYRDFLKPRHAELMASVRELSNAKVFFHSCGNVYPLIGDLVDVGVDVLNPIQVSAAQMGDTARLKREFGSRLTFCGGIDTGSVLPTGSTDDVRREVRRRIADLAPGGGYVLSAVHCIQPDVPIDNVLAMFDEARVAGRYPLQV